MGTEFINGLGSRSSLICAVNGAESHGLTTEEQRLMVCVGPGALLGEVILDSGLSEARAIALLLGLRLRGLIQPGGTRRPSMTPVGDARQPTPFARPSPASMPSPAIREKTAGPIPVDAMALSEPVDLDLERKKEILDLDQRCLGDDYFAMLELPVDAGAADVKKAYYELSKRFHPDRFFGKNLGTYKARIDRIFRKLTEAQATLSDASRRQAYLAHHPELAEASAPAVALDPAKAAERRARLARHPYLAKAAKVHELSQRGRTLVEKGEFARAFTDLSLAAQLDPKSKEIQDLLQAAKKGGDRSRAEKEFQEGESAEKMGSLADALARMRNAAQLDLENAGYAARLTRVILATGSGPAELKEAHTMARRAAELEPNNADHRLLFARVLYRAGLEKNAQREFEAVLKLRPDDPIAKEHVKKLRWRLK